VSRPQRTNSHAQQMASLVSVVHDRVNRSLTSINRSLRTIQRTRDRIPSGREAALRVERRYERELQDALGHLSPHVTRQMALGERLTAATAISAELIEVGLELLETSRQRLLGPESDHRIDARGAPRGEVARGERDEDEQHGGAAERARIDGADPEQQTP
jgi:hypothetical protein